LCQAKISDKNAKRAKKSGDEPISDTRIIARRFDRQSHLPTTAGIVSVARILSPEYPFNSIGTSFAPLSNVVKL
jgi:hypothetical protein